MHMSFTVGLIVFTIFLFPLYLFLLLISNRAKKQGFRKTPTGSWLWGARFSILIETLALIIIMFFEPFRVNPWYFVLSSTSAGCLLFSVMLSPNSKKVRNYILLSVILLHFRVVFAAPTGFSIHETTAAYSKMAQQGAWDSSWRLTDPYFNPFPLEVGLTVIFSEITSISFISTYIYIIFVLALVATLHITLCFLAEQFVGEWQAGILGSLMLTSIPFPLNASPAQLSLLLVLISMVAFAKILHNDSPIPNIFLFNFSFIIAIFIHANAASLILYIASIAILGFFMSKVGGFKAERKIMVPSLTILLTTLATIALARCAFIPGVIESALQPLKAFLGPQGEWVGATYTPLEESYASPIHAYGWSTPFSMASALAAYYIFNKTSLSARALKDKRLLILAMYSIGAALLLFGFLGGKLSPSAGLQQYLGYPAFVFLTPIAAIAGQKILRSFRILGVTVLVLIVISHGIGLTDPSVSPKLYEGIQSRPAAQVADYSESRTLFDILPTNTYIIATYEMLSCFNYLNTLEVKTITPLYTSLKTQRILIDRVIKEEEVMPGSVYIWSSDIEPRLPQGTNIIYHTGRHLAFKNEITTKPF